MRIASLLQSKGAFVATIAPGQTLEEVLAALAEHGVGALVVTDDGEHITGIVSERDVVRALHRRGVEVLTEPVSAVMTAEVRTCTPEETIEALMALMTEQRIRHVPVVENDKLAGIVSIGDLVKERMGELERENSAIVEYIQTGRCQAQRGPRQQQVLLGLRGVEGDVDPAVGQQGEPLGLVGPALDGADLVEVDRASGARCPCGDAGDAAVLVGEEVEPPVEAGREVAGVARSLGDVVGRAARSCAIDRAAADALPDHRRGRCASASI